MNHRIRNQLLMLLDTLIILIAFSASFIIVDVPSVVFSINYWLSASIILFSYHLSSIYFKMNRKAWEYASVGELQNILKTLTVAILLNGSIQFILFSHIQYRVLFVTWVLMVLGIGGTRFLWRLKKESTFQHVKERKRTLIVGAGSAGTMIARQLLYNAQCELKPVLFVDDDPNKQQLDIFALPVPGGTSQIPELVKAFEIERIIIAIPSLERKKMKTIYESCLQANVKTQILPMIEDLVTGKLSVKELRDVSPEDLLGREQVKLQHELIESSIKGKTVLVTGAGGSIGSELCRQIIYFRPEKLVLLGHGENSIYHIYMELKEEAGETKILPVIADVQDLERMREVMQLFQPHQVYHAAAHKHVPLMEESPWEAVKNNTLGSLNTATAALENKVKSFVMISTDKAVNPTSVMGASKRLAEMLITHLNDRSNTSFTIVRFGNVLGSNGSVIPLFKKQIERGGPVTVTHPEMVRYFMTIPEASRLVLQAGSLSKGGETFVLDMGEPVKIVDLARNLISLSGYTQEEIAITYTGIRSGEKLYEELLNSDEIHEEQVYPKIYLGKATKIPLHEIEQFITQYHELDKDTLRDRLLELANRKTFPMEIVSTG
ncbi:polysaccharide biosynthesis protein [Alkalicoccus daliensis]|uniref:NDP-sugar epimerase, includes UDP-GlcNAc-inverting 4,6-dehydratase FlaA1 and capsular polysaccharide biosynthesis protein EpsC n=1 Tax=Alkalicoccus daliensis TaxID=745820 RepID=A0A1G9ZKL4_9BACI|nr:nucleoside-diphosphate sugar epimerase/dehydratase [Alkalicoccus daliensis]SDN21665.1 NDP-sugar epimerase, includes UDP-GlcNAc-inverting 4,6-dehydratase FlaA1 and capsular polysaccharide biosynthesis protein EpsC [Alkalicoccus daliensis]